jgi:hypothetical protein
MKNILLIIVLVAVVAGGAYQLGYLSQTQQVEVEEVTTDQLPETIKPVSAHLTVTDYVPADTVLFLGGKMDKKIADFMADFPMFYFAASERAAIQQMKKALAKESSPEARFLQYLIQDFQQNVDGSIEQYLSHYGFAKEGEYAIYMHGLVPVMNLEMADPEKLRKRFLDASNSSNLAYEESEIGLAKVISWQLDNVPARLLLATTSSTAVLTLAMAQDDDVVIKQRIAQARVEDSFTSRFAALRQQYHYTQDMVGVMELEKLFLGLLKADDSLLSKDIERYIPEQDYQQLFDANSDLVTCQADIRNWLAAAPRTVTGYRELDIKDNAMIAKSHSIWEVKNPLVNQALQQMQGNLASHLLNWNDQAMSVGLAIDVAAVAPALTSLWQAFTEAEVSCEPLKQVQQEAGQFSPMMIGMMTGMAQGLKGISLSLFDLKFDQAAETPVELDAVMTVEAKNPATLVSLLQMAPELESIKIPTDGSEAKFPLPLPYDLNVKGTVKGSHIVFYTGKKASQVRDQIASEAIPSNALGMGLLVDNKKMVEIASSNGLLMLAGGDESMCMEGLSMSDQMQYMDMNFLYHPTVAKDGPELLLDMVFPKPTKPNFDIQYEGTWKTAYLDENCRWLDAGVEIIDADSGTYAEKDDTASCEVFKTAYTWKRHGAQIEMTDSAPTLTRENCNEEWETDKELATLYCELMHVEQDSFMCLFHDDAYEPFVQRYVRQ